MTVLLLFFVVVVAFGCFVFFPHLVKNFQLSLFFLLLLMSFFYIYVFVFYKYTDLFYLVSEVHTLFA